MKLQFIGVGSAFALENYQSNMVLEKNGRHLLIDAGGDVRHALKAVGKSYLDIDAIFISHLHADHCGGLEYLAFTTYFDPRVKDRPMLIGRSQLLDNLWGSMRYGAASIQNKIMTLDSYFIVCRVGMDGVFDFEGTEFGLVRTEHIMNGYEVIPSYGLKFKGDTGGMVLLSTDTQRCFSQADYHEADIIFHDCETAKSPSGVHTHFNDLKELPAATKRKMWLYHYQDGPLPNAIAEGFVGFIKQGQVFDL